MKTLASFLFILIVAAVSCSAPTYVEPREIAPWQGWNKYQIKPEDTLTAYGHELIANTSYYLGPNGKVAALTNGMNCQNCHLQGGTLPWGNNYGAVSSTYPKFRARSGGLETISKRVNDCMERSLNGKPLDSNSREMQAIIAYMKWLGDDVPKGTIPKGAGIKEIPEMDRPANPARGLIVYQQQCQSCHGANGQGQKNIEGYGFTYPPVWGPASYNTGAGLYRISRLAGYVKYNMPFGAATYSSPVLSDEESWDVAAYINSMPHPTKDISNDWPDISKKPKDHPFGPFADGKTEEQHKYGPWSKK